MNSADADKIVNTVKGVALCHIPTLYNTLSMTEKVVHDGIEGDLVECGVFAGAQVAVMALTLQAVGEKERRIHLYDSFEGIPEAGPEDADQPGIGAKKFGDGRLVSTGVSSCSADQVREYMQTWNVDVSRLVYHEGWFQNTVYLWDAGGIALLRLDGDLYESTLCCMDNLHPCLNTGGVLIIDDYHLRGCRKAVDKYFEERNETLTVNLVEGGGGPVWAIKT